jgi:hypothetical protein
LSESCFNNSIFLALFDVYGCKYTKIAVKTPQFTKEIAIFLPQNINYEEKGTINASTIIFMTTHVIWLNGVLPAFHKQKLPMLQGNSFFYLYTDFSHIPS